MMLCLSAAFLLDQIAITAFDLIYIIDLELRLQVNYVYLQLFVLSCSKRKEKVK
jgi:hypothetical protein